MDAFPFAGRRCERMTEAVMKRLGFPHNSGGTFCSATISVVVTFTNGRRLSCALAGQSIT